MATTYDLTSAPQTGYAIGHGSRRDVKFQTFNLALGATHAASDVYKLITIPAGTYVLRAYLVVKTASTTSSSKVSIGDSSGATALLAATSATSATMTAGTTGKYYAAADYAAINLDGTTPPADGIYEVILECLYATNYGSTW